MSGLSTLGMAAGLYLAYKKDNKFWGYVGFAIAGSILGVACGKIISSLLFPPVKM